MLTVPRVLGAAPIVQGKALLTSDGGGQAFIEVKGVVPAQEKTVTRIQEAMLTGSLEALETEPGTTPGILDRQGPRRRSCRSGSAITVEMFTPEGTLTPIGLHDAPAAVQGRRARSAWGCSSTTRPTGSSASTWRSGRSARTRRTSSSCGSTTCSRRREIADGDPRAAGGRVHGAGLGRSERGAVLRAVAREDGHLDHHRPHRDGGGHEHHRVARAPGHGEEPRHRDPEDDGQLRREHPADFHAAGARDRPRRDGRRRGGRAARSSTSSIGTS